MESKPLSLGVRITFWAIVISLPLVAILIGIYVVSYLTIQPTVVMSFEGDSIIASDPEIGFVPRPNGRTKMTWVATPEKPEISYSVYTDDRGARITIPGQRSPAHIDIMTLGSSFTWGHGIENKDTFAAKVAQRLGVSGSNFSLGSYRTVQLLQILRRNRDLSPKLVVFGLHTDHLPTNLMACAPSSFPFCLDVSHVTFGADGRPRITLPSSDGVKRINLQMKAESGWLDPVTWITHGVDVAFSRLTLRVAERNIWDETKQEAALTFLLEEMARTVDAMGAKLLVVYIPIYLAAAPPPLLRSVAKAKVHFIDVTDAFQRNEKIPGNPSVYIPGDGHPSIAGHALIADEIVRTIQQERLLDR